MCTTSVEGVTTTSAVWPAVLVLLGFCFKLAAVPLHFQAEITKFTSPNKRDYSDWGEG